MGKTDNIFLIGFMGCGKSTVASKLNQMYGMHVVEMDQEISNRQKMSIPDIFEQYGEEYFRDLESALVKEITTSSEQVVSCGGGVVLRENNVIEMKKNGHIVLLTAKPENVLKRVEKNDDRPILKGRKTVKDIAELMGARREKYEEAADIIVATDDKSIEEISKEILERIKEIGEINYV